MTDSAALKCLARRKKHLESRVSDDKPFNLAEIAALETATSCIKQCKAVHDILKPLAPKSKLAELLLKRMDDIAFAERDGRGWNEKEGSEGVSNA